jgi:hypothetical protein
VVEAAELCYIQAMMRRWHAFRAARRHGALATMIVGALAASAAASSAASSPTMPLQVAVETKGSLPGFSDSELPDYFAAAMNAVTQKGWHFAPGPASSVPADRIELSFETNAYAAGAVRTYGISRATMERLLNVHHSITIEARLFLGDQYQTLFFEQVTVSGGPHDAELDDAVAKLTRALTAYPALKTGPNSGVDFLISHSS